MLKIGYFEHSYLLEIGKYSYYNQIHPYLNFTIKCVNKSLIYYFQKENFHAINVVICIKK